MNRQLSLFPELDEPENPARDYMGVSDLVYWQDFLSPVEQTKLLHEIDARPWLNDLRRRVQHYGYRYDYKARRVNPDMFIGPLPSFLAELATRLFTTGLVTKIPDQAIINEYEPGQGITPHIDCEPCFGDFIATISLSSVYAMEFDDAQNVEESKSIKLGLGSCLVLSKDARYRWRHGIKARKTDDGTPRGRRVSVTFRTVTT